MYLKINIYNPFSDEHLYIFVMNISLIFGYIFVQFSDKHFLFFRMNINFIIRIIVASF